ncbi:Pentatricopeptide repeat-containing protein [Platanthera guangdongensis]|uniref:Pentatricopeptide repeat-containing protein n=1 Tax=Platanthera guangdongensis TaxID=2320717 RepID=A0ABR2MUA0_9ASPA
MSGEVPERQQMAEFGLSEGNQRIGQGCWTVGKWAGENSEEEMAFSNDCWVRTGLGMVVLYCTNNWWEQLWEMEFCGGEEAGRLFGGFSEGYAIVRDMTAAGLGLNKFCYAGLITAYKNKQPTTNEATEKIIEFVKKSKEWSSIETSSDGGENVMMNVSEEELYNIPTAEYVHRRGFLRRPLTVYHVGLHACADLKRTPLKETILAPCISTCDELPASSNRYPTLFNPSPWTLALPGGPIQHRRPILSSQAPTDAALGLLPPMLPLRHVLRKITPAAANGHARSLRFFSLSERLLVWIGPYRGVA